MFGCERLVVDRMSQERCRYQDPAMQCAKFDETDLVLDDIDDLDELSKWNANYPERAWDTAPEAWSVLDALTADERHLLERLQRARKRMGHAIDISIANVLPIAQCEALVLRR